MTNKAMTDILLVIFFALVFARSAKDIGAWIWESVRKIIPPYKYCAKRAEK
jgi:hypothetical protein